MYLECGQRYCEVLISALWIVGEGWPDTVKRQQRVLLPIASFVFNEADSSNSLPLSNLRIGSMTVATNPRQFAHWRCDAFHVALLFAA